MKQYWRVVWDFVGCRGVYNDGMAFLTEDLYDDPKLIRKLKLRFDQTDPRALCDFPKISSLHGMFLSNRLASGLLIGIFLPDCSRHIVRCNAELYDLFICDIETDAFDYDNSSFERFSDTGGVFDVTKFVLRASKIPDHHVFRLSGDNALRHQVFVSQDFRGTYESGNLTGLSFREVGFS